MATARHWLRRWNITVGVLLHFVFRFLHYNLKFKLLTYGPVLLNVRLVVCFFSISMVSWLVPAGMTMAAKVLPR